MVDSRTNYSKDISNLIRESYGGKLKVYKTDIPRSVRAEEISAEGHSIFQHDPKGKVLDLINASEAREDGWLSDRRGSVLACRWYWNDGENERPPCYFVFIPINLVHIVCFSCKLLFSFRLLSAGFSASFGINHIRLNFATPGIRFSSHSF